MRSFFFSTLLALLIIFCFINIAFYFENLKIADEVKSGKVYIVDIEGNTWTLLGNTTVYYPNHCFDSAFKYFKVTVELNMFVFSIFSLVGALLVAITTFIVRKITGNFTMSPYLIALLAPVIGIGIFQILFSLRSNEFEFFHLLHTLCF